MTADTKCSGKYDSLSHHSIIRNGLEIEGEQSVVAMEYHYEDNTSSHTMTLASFLAPYLADVGTSTTVFAPSLAGCYQSYESFTVTSSSRKTETESNLAPSVFDLDTSTSWSENSYYQWVDLAWSNWIPQVNGFAIHTSSYRSYAPSSFTLRGYKHTEDSQSTLLLSKSDTEYDNNGWNYFNLVVNDKIYQRIRMQITKTGSTSLRFFELGYLTCRVSVPTAMELTQTEVEASTFVDTVVIKPRYDGFVQCSVSPSLPSGMSITFSSCVIQGIPRVAVDHQTYTVTAKQPFETTATFTLTVTDCPKMVIEISRTYGASDYIYETHWLRSLEGTTVERVYKNTVQKASATIKNRYCIDGGLYELSVDHTTSTAWAADSYININIVHGTDVVTVTHWKYDIMAGYGPSITINLGESIKRGEEWSFLMGDVPAGWDSNTIPDSWEKKKMGEFPESTNQLQLYKKKFSLAEDPVGSGYEIELRYSYGCIIVINGIEVFRRGVEGTPTNETYSSVGYPSPSYRRISLPEVIPAQGETAAKSVIVKGENTITVLLVARLATQKTAAFDLSLRLFGRDAVSRIADFSVSATDTEVSTAYLFDLSSATVYASTSCSSDRYIQIQFNNDRREWISKYIIINSNEKDKASPYAWKLQAMNDEDDDWTTLDTITSAAWWKEAQAKEVWVNNLKPYNRYRFYQIAAQDTSDCTVNILQLLFLSDSLNRDMPELDYVGSPVGYLSVGLSDLVPNCDYYSKFTVTPALPAWLTLDYVTGVIRGESVQKMDPTPYTITAKKLDGTDSSKTLTLSIITCDKVMIEVIVLSDYYPNECSWAVYEGESIEGTPIFERKELEARNSREYKYFCFDNGVYTFKFADSWGDGWTAPAGFKIQTSKGFPIAMGSVPATDSKPSVVTRTISTYQMIPTQSPAWKLSKGSAGKNWNSPSFDDSKWETVTGGGCGTYDGATVYLRHTFEIPDINKFTVLNAAARFNGGIVGYLNGQRVYRVNMGTDYDSKTTSEESHPGYSYMEFSIPLQLRGGVTGKNVLAFEVHRYKSDVASTDNPFDGFAILGMGDCALLRNDPSTYEASNALSGTSAYGLIDESPFYYLSWDWTEGDYFRLVYENREGVLFNQYRLHTDVNNGEVSWNAYAKKADGEVYTTFDTAKLVTIPSRSYYAQKVPNGLMGYNELRFDFINVLHPTGFTLTEVELYYCAYDNSRTCPGVGQYPMTGEGEKSVGPCPDFYDGYSFRECRNGKLGDVDTTMCKKFPPKNLAYEKTMYEIYVGATPKDLKPKIYGLVDGYEIQPLLPEGLTLNKQTGAVEGAARNVSTTITTYTVTAFNEMGSTQGTFQLKIVLGQCKADGEMFKPTAVGETFVYDCAQVSGNFGKVTRACKMGKNEPEWGPTIGMCMSKTTFIVLGLLLVVVVLIVIVAVVKVMSDKKKANKRSGVRGGKKPRNVMKSVPYAKI